VKKLVYFYRSKNQTKYASISREEKLKQRRNIGKL